jgi:hypothetical protein
MAATETSSTDLKVPDGHVLVRMYDIGFGDCFLLCFLLLSSDHCRITVGSLSDRR